LQVGTKVFSLPTNFILLYCNLVGEVSKNNTLYYVAFLHEITSPLPHTWNLGYSEIFPNALKLLF